MSERIRKTLPVLGLAALGLAISIVAHVVHVRLGADANYASFCNVNSVVNCDAVLTSRYASFAGISVALWAILYYAVILALTLAATVVTRPAVRERAAVLTLVAAGWGLLFSVYMAVIAVGVLHAVCLMCSGLYLVSVGLFATTWRVRSQFRVSGRRPLSESAWARSDDAHGEANTRPKRHRPDPSATITAASSPMGPTNLAASSCPPRLRAPSSGS